MAWSGCVCEELRLGDNRGVGVDRPSAENVTGQRSVVHETIEGVPWEAAKERPVMTLLQRGGASSQLGRTGGGRESL